MFKKKLQQFTLKQTLLIIIPIITSLGFLFLSYTYYHVQHKQAFQNRIDVQAQLMHSIKNDVYETFKLRDYLEVKKTLSSYNENYSGQMLVLDERNDIIASNVENIQNIFSTVQKWIRQEKVKQKFKGESFSHFIVFQEPLFDRETETYFGTFISFFDSSLFGFQNSILKYKLILLGIIFFIVQTIIIVLLSNKIFSPLEDMLSQLSEEDDPEKIIQKLKNEKNTETKDVLKLSSQLSKYYAKNITDITLGKLTAQLAHDLRNPLNILKTYISLDQKECDNELFAEMKQASIRAEQRMGSMVSELLDFSRTKKLSFSHFSLAKSLQEISYEVISSLQNQKHISLNMEKVDVDTYITADKLKIERVLTNILVNAAQAISHEGKITIHTKQKQHYTIVSLSDSGCGIKPEHLDSIFDSTFTFGKKNGLGLGLSYCKNVIEAHGGKIEVQSKAQQGTTFIITLPTQTEFNCI